MNSRAAVFSSLAVVGLAVAVGMGYLLGRSNQTSAPAEASVSTKNALPESVTEAAPYELKNLAPAEQLARAFEAAFGETRAANRQIDGATITFKPGSLVWLGDRVALVSEGEMQDACYVCQGMLAIQYLAPNGSGFRVTRSWLDGGGTSFAGMPPEHSITRKFMDEPLLFTGNVTSHAPFCGWASLIQFRPSGPVVIATIPTSYDDGDGTEVEGVIGNIQKGYAFDVAIKGSITGVDHYVRDGEKFVLASGKSKIPSCD